MALKIIWGRMSAISAPANRARFMGIFIVALVAVAYQVLLTRIFSVTLYYHFAFAGISLAMLGLTIGAEKVYLGAGRFSPERFDEEWARAALGFSITSVLLVIYFLCVPLVLPAGVIMTALAFSMLLFIIPFTYSGICVTLILTRSASVGKLYAADLTGAALGCVGIVALMFFLDPVSILFFLAALTAYAAWVMARGAHANLARKAGTVMLLMIIAGITQGALVMSNSSHLGVFWAKGKKQESLLFERWNTISRVRVVPWPLTYPFGWGFGRYQPLTIDQLYLDIDADAGTILTHFNGDLRTVAFLSDDVINMGYHIRPVQSVAVIGVGGGRDVMSALYFGAKKIIGIELNPAIFEVLTQKFADFTGHFAQRPEVSLVNAEACSWIGQHRPQVDLVQISLIDTWAATAAGGLTLTENRLYTLEAWKEFLGTLNPRGMLVVSRWFDPKGYPGEFYRLLSLASDSLQARGVPRAEVRKHILAFNVGNIITVAVSPSVFSPEETAHVHQVASELGFSVLMANDAAFDETSRVIASGEATPDFYGHLPMDVTTPTDNRPFFFFMKRFKDWFHPDAEDHNAVNNVALTVVFVIFFGTLSVTVGFIIEPLRKLAGSMPLGAVVTDLMYFAGIGLGFMLIEISQMQRLIVFLGHPVYGLSVVLFSLLLFGGIGSATVHEDTRPERLWKRPLLLCLVLCAVGVLTPALTAQFVPFGTVARILVSVALLAPAGLCMGMMFPAGMVLSARHRDMQPWFWGINGAVSVFASILGMMISMAFGIASAYWTGVAAYGLCLWIALINRSKVA
jgi:MFS family permease